jgi:hypothetical protein
MDTRTKNHPDFLFELRVDTMKERVIIRAFDGGPERGNGNRIDVEVCQGGKVIFPIGKLYCGTPACGGMSLDGIAAKELVMSTVATKPGDTDEEYFRGYTAAQLGWVTEYGETLAAIREFRYCDENGNVRKS